MTVEEEVRAHLEAWARNAEGVVASKLPTLTAVLTEVVQRRMLEARAGCMFETRVACAQRARAALADVQIASHVGAAEVAELRRFCADLGEAVYAAVLDVGH